MDRFLEADSSILINLDGQNNIRVANYLGATRQASNPSSINVELSIVTFHSSELNFLQ
jgi:hypothetical protein